MIPVRNVYYMLAYAFQTLQERGFKSVLAERFANTAELLAEILTRGVAGQIKRGLEREYLETTAPLASPRGKFFVANTLRENALGRKTVVCEFDEFSENSYANRVVKTALELLVRAPISAARKKNLRKAAAFLSNVSTLNPRRIDPRFSPRRGSPILRTLVSLSLLAINGLLQTNADGSTRVVDFFDEQTEAKLFEKFILNYFKREAPRLRVSSPRIDWRLDVEADEDAANGGDCRGAALLPTMRSDVVLQNPATGKTLILDAKYYARNLQQDARFGKRTIYSAHLYQIFAYVKNWSAGADVFGLLLYAQTDSEIQPDADLRICGSRIGVRTLDLNRDFAEISARLDRIAVEAF